MMRRPYQRVIYHAPSKELNEDVALLLGLHAVDGWLSDKWGITCKEDDTSMFFRVMELGREVLGVEPIKPARCPDGKAVMIRSGQPQSLVFFRGYGFPQGRKAGSVDAPKQIPESNDESILKVFLRGLFSTDGCFSFQINRGPGIEIRVKSEKLRDGFLTLVSRLGFSFRAHAYLPPNGKNKSPLQVAYTTQRKQVVRWMEEAGSIKDAHIRRYQDWKAINRMRS
jgi:hypothetical protein